MPINDLREWISAVHKRDDLRVVRGVNCELEMSALSEAIARDRKSPRWAVLFDDIPGYPAGHRVLIDSCATLSRTALTLGMNPDIDRRDFPHELKRRMKEMSLIPPRLVKSGPILENMLSGSKADLGAIPAPRWHTGDGGPYIGTGSVTITRDADSGWVNLGTYRIMMHDPRTLSFMISPSRHGALHREKQYARGEPIKVAVSLGHDPLLMLAGSTPIPAGMGEYDWCGGLRGEPIDVITGPDSGLPIPATAEIVVEGISYPNEVRPEGPYGEFHGYYAGLQPNCPVIHVTNVMYRNAPIQLAVPMICPSAGTLEFPSLIREALVLDMLEKAGVPDIRGIHFHEAAAGLMFNIISLKQRYAGHSRQAARMLTQSTGNLYMGRYTIVVDEDINPYDMNEVIWAMGTRSDPQHAIEILTHCLTGPLDPAIKADEQGRKVFNSRAIIDACKPWDWKDKFPPSVETPPEMVAQARQRFGDQLASVPVDPLRVG